VPLESQQLSATVPLSGSLAEHVKITLPGGCEMTSVMLNEMTSVMLVTVSAVLPLTSWVRTTRRLPNTVPRPDGRVRCNREVAVLDLACRERGRRRRGADQNLVLPRCGVAILVRALPERRSAHAQISPDVEVPKTGKVAERMVEALGALVCVIVHVGSYHPDGGAASFDTSRRARLAPGAVSGLGGG
jgi:hypothetical protein